MSERRDSHPDPESPERSDREFPGPERSEPEPPDRPETEVSESSIDGDEEIPGYNPEDEVIPPTPGRRRLAMLIGLIFLVGILVFLIVFFATHWERSPGVLGMGAAGVAAEILLK